jgi:outer membrane protein OmpA-like peptidoglycan-associated protein
MLPAQEPSEALKETFYDAEFFLLEEFYQDALPEYLKIYKRGFEDNANLNYKIGICYLNIPGEKEKSIPHFQKAAQDVTPRYNEGVFRETKAPLDVYLFLGNAYRVTNQLDKAIQSYEAYKNLDEKLPEENITYANQQIEACNRAKSYKKEPLNIKFTNLGPTINGSSANYRAVVTSGEDLIAYMTRLKFYDAVYVSTKIDGEWSEPLNITPQIKSDGDYFTSGIFSGGKSMILSREDNFDSDIYISNFNGELWEEPDNIREVNTKFWETHASLSPDGNMMVFASNRNNGFGEMDIYYTEKTADGQWGEVKNIGKTINTPMNEESPFITADGKKLFFSSQGHNTMGGYDIFYSVKNDDGSWSSPVNAGYPLNTTDDDIFYQPHGDGTRGFISRFEDDGYGDYDIYKVEIFPDEPEEPQPLTDAMEEVVPEVQKEAKPVEQPDAVQEYKEDSLTAFVDSIAEKDTKTNEGEKPVAGVVPGKEAEDQDAPTAEEPDPPTETAATGEAKEPLSEEREKEIAEQKKFVIKNILFGFDSYQLDEQAKKKLNVLASAMKDFEDLQLKVIGHTDAMGPKAYNQMLSEKRSQAVINYLKEKGIDQSRLTKTGAGEEKNIAINKNPDGTDNPRGRKYNRRVEFKVTSEKADLFIIEPLEIPGELKAE